MPGYVTHKRIHDDEGNPHCLCPTPGGTETRYNWTQVTCRKCQEIGNELNYNSKQLKEIARIRRDKVRLAALDLELDSLEESITGRQNKQHKGI